MILLLLVVLVVAVLAARYLALPRPVVRAALHDHGDQPGVIDVVRRGVPYAYQYVLCGPGGRDVGDHDAAKLVVRADRVHGGLILVRVASVDRVGKRTGRSRVLLLTR